MKTSYKYTVVGIGGVGSAAAYWLSRLAGTDVLGIEQFEIDHARGGSQDYSRIIRREYHRPEYTELAGHAYDVWSEMEGEAEERVVLRTGSLNFGPQGSIVMKYIESLVANNVPHQIMTPDDVTRRWPQFKLTSEMIAVSQPDGGLVDPSRATRAHVRMARARGATILERTPVQCIQVRDGYVEIKTAAGTFDTHRLVIACGAWTKQVLAGLGINVPITVTQEQVTYFTSPRLEDFSPDRFPIWIGHNHLDECFYGFPVYGEAAVKIGQDAGEREVTTETRSFDPDPENLERVLGFMNKYLPSAVGPILRTKTCLYTMPPDRNFIIDCLPGFPQVVVAVGAGHVFKFASLVGKMLCQIASEGSTEYPSSLFKMDRPAITDPMYQRSLHI